MKVETLQHAIYGMDNITANDTVIEDEE